MWYIYKDIKFLKLKKDEKAELKKKITVMDQVILDMAKSRPRGVDLYALVNTCRPFKNKYGKKEFAGIPQVRKAVDKLVELGLLEGR